MGRKTDREIKLRAGGGIVCAVVSLFLLEGNKNEEPCSSVVALFLLQTVCQILHRTMKAATVHALIWRRCRSHPKIVLFSPLHEPVSISPSVNALPKGIERDFDLQGILRSQPPS